MMVDTITVAGKTYPKTLLYAVGAGAVGVVGYAWWTKGREPIPTEPIVDTEYPSPTTPSYTGGSSGFFDITPDKYETEQDWYNDALQKLIYDYGVADTPIASEVLNKYLDQQPLTTEQQKMVAFVINSIGPPPTGARSIRTETKPPTTVPPPTETPTEPPSQYGLVVGVASAGRDRITWRWNHVYGVSYYTVLPVKVSQGNIPMPLQAVDTHSWTWYYANPGETYNITVVAYNSAQQEIARASAQASTLP